VETESFVKTTQVKITAYAVSIAYSAALALTGLKLPGMAVKLLGFVPTVIILAFAVFDKWLWKLGPLVKLAHRPNLSGTWHGQLVSYRAVPNGKEKQHPPVPVVLVITQTFTTLTVTLMTAESKSRSEAELLTKNGNGDYTVRYHYVNVPRLEHRDRSPIHGGGSSLEFTGDTPSHLDGEYWTTRRSRGTFAVSRVARSTQHSFSSAMTLGTVGAEV
jgi:hypothetical protein